MLTILEPDAEVCKLVAKLATVGTATAGDTDTKVLVEIKQNLSKIKEELATLETAELQKKQERITNYLG